MLWTGFLFGFLGGFHCVGMCGPIALALPGGGNSRLSYISGRLAYNFGRIITYSLLGLMFGMFGQGLQVAGLQQTISIISGVLILLFIFFPASTSSKISSKLGISAVVSRLKKSLGSFLKTKSIFGLTMIGILNGLLPCGFVYLALAATISFHSLNESVLYMTFFGLGTLPIMLFVALSGQLLNLKFRGFINKTIPYAACVLGVLFILRGLSLGIPYVSPVISSPGSTTEVMKCH